MFFQFVLYIFFVFSLISFFLSLSFMSTSYDLIMEINMVDIYSCSTVMTLLFNWMSLLFGGFVMFISSMVTFYIVEYMEGNLNINRFILLIIMFVASMLLLIFSPNLVSILLGWDGFGLVSYCLVIYYQNVKSYNVEML